MKTPIQKMMKWPLLLFENCAIRRLVITLNVVETGKKMLLCFQNVRDIAEVFFPALNMPRLCSVLFKARRNRQSTKEVYGKTRVLYNRREHSQGFLICFMIKNPIISPGIPVNFQTKPFFSKEVKMASAVLSSLIKHAKIS